MSAENDRELKPEPGYTDPPPDTEGGQGGEGVSQQDDFGRETAMGDTGTTAAQAGGELGAPPRVDKAPPGMDDVPREDLPPNTRHPDARSGWDEAADLTKAPAVIPDPAEVDVPDDLRRAIESPRGELGCFVLADGSAKPARVHMRDPSFVNLQATAPMVKDAYIADFIATLAMMDPVLGGIDR